MSATQPLELSLAMARQTIAGVKADQLQDSTPCASWDVSALINHMVGSQKFFAAGMSGTAPEGADTNFAAGDYLASFDETAGACLVAFQAEGALERTVELPFGSMPGVGVLGLVTTDIFVHTWDLAKATGQNTDLAPELAASLLEQSQQSIQPEFRGPDGQAPFGPEQVAPAGASAADQLAAFLGRQV